MSEWSSGNKTRERGVNSKGEVEREVEVFLVVAFLREWRFFERELPEEKNLWRWRKAVVKSSSMVKLECLWDFCCDCEEKVASWSF